MMTWSDIHCLSDYLNAPLAFGVYIIGTYTGLAPLPVAGTPIADKFLGENYPAEIIEQYLGRAYRVPLRYRLSAHFRGRGNSEVRKYLQTHGPNSLVFIYTTREMPEMVEHALLHGTTLGPWNKRRDESSVIRREAKRLYDELDERQKKLLEIGPY
jgi:ribosomal protein L21E